MNSILGTHASSAPVTLLQSEGALVIIQSQEIDGELLHIIYFHLYACNACFSIKIIVNEIQIPPEDIDEMFVEGFMYDETLQDQGLVKINYDITVK